MQRRKAIGLILGIGGTTAVSLVGYKWYTWNKFFDPSDYLEHKKDLLTALAETIIPETDTLGARSAGVGNFIYIMVKDCSERKTQNKFIEGLKDLEAYCLSQYAKTYLQCSADEKMAVLQYFRSKEPRNGGIVKKIENKYLGQSFYSTLRQYTISGYCTSKQGATQALAYIAIPGKYIGCMPLEKGQKAWATS
jgi:hypothetical protein